MRYRKILTLIIAFTASISGNSQYLPRTGQPYQFISLYNPAFTGVEPFGDLKLGYRYQWGSFGSDAPRFINLAYQFQLAPAADPRLHSLRNSSSGEVQAVPKMKDVIHGFGSNLFDEELGLIKRLGGGIHYAFHFPLTSTLRLAAGVSGVVENMRVDLSKVYLGSQPDPDPLYEQLIMNRANRTDVNVRAGILFYAPRFYLGVSYLPVWRTIIDDTEWGGEAFRYRGTLQTGYSLALSEGIQLRPSVVALLDVIDNVILDYNVKVLFRDKVWFGLTYRDTRSGIALLGYNVNRLLAATYSYELSTGAWRQFGDGSHELVLSLRMNNFRDEKPYIW